MLEGADAARPRARILAPILIPTLLVALTGALVALDRPTSGEPGGAAARFLPEDGASARYRLQDGTVRTVEHARVVGVEGALTAPDVVSSSVIGALGEQGVRSAHFWRELTSTGDEQFDDLYVLGDDGVRQVASWGGVVGFTFEPGMLLLPSDVAPGAEWSSGGSALGDGALTYESEFQASAADEDLNGADGATFTPAEGCLRIDGTLTLEQPGEGVLLTSTDTSVWCPGEGRVFSSGEQNGEAVGSVLVPDGTALPGPPADDEREAVGASGVGVLQTLDAVVVDPFFGDSLRQGSVTTAPALTRSGIVVTANEHGDDLLAWRPESDRAVLAWSAHPGGTIATVSAVGDIVVAATEDRVVRAYDDLGRRLWSWTGDDLALAPAVGVPGTGDVLVATRGGTLARLAGEDGTQRWSTTIGADARGAFVVVGETVVIADERGRINGINAATGELQWRSEVGMAADLAGPPEDAAPLAYLLTEDGELLAIDARTGETAWEAALTGLVRGVSAGRDGAVAATDEETVWFRAEDGSEIWRIAGSQAVLAASGNRVVSLTADRLVLTGADGRVDAEAPLPPRADPADPHLLLSGNDAVVVGPGLQLWRMGLG